MWLLLFCDNVTVRYCIYSNKQYIIQRCLLNTVADRNEEYAFMVVDQFYLQSTGPRALRPFGIQVSIELNDLSN